MPSCKFADWLARPDSRIAVVGASGWIGMALVDQILAVEPSLSPDRLRLFGSGRRPLHPGAHRLQIEPLEGAEPLRDGDWLVLHAAVVGADRVEGEDGTEIRRRNDRLMQQVLTLAQTGQTRRLVFFSSGAAGRRQSGGPARQAYAQMKHDHEVEIADWAERTERAVLTPRVFNLGGPFINHAEAYALGDFILGLTQHERINIGASRPVFRSYVHVLEMARVILDMAVDDAQSPAAFDVGGAEIVELHALARLVAQVLGRVEAVITRPEPDGSDGDWYVGEAQRYQNALFQLGERPMPLTQIVADTAAYLEAAEAARI